jgi:N-acetylmuramoyl-L-alanine amidase
MWHVSGTLALFGWSLLAPALPHTRVADAPAIIVIDPGHGGEDAGATGADGTLEKDLTLTYSIALRDALQVAMPEAVVVLTRYGDEYPSLEARAQLANRLDADLFLSIHANSATNLNARGVETFFLDPRGTAPGELVPGREHEGPCGVHHEVGVTGDVLAVVLDDLGRDGAQRRSAALAEAVQLRLVQASGALDRGVRQGQFRVLRGLRAPAVVVELGFLSNDSERAQLLSEDYRSLLVGGLVEAVTDYVAWDELMTARLHPAETDLDAQASLR